MIVQNHGSIALVTPEDFGERLWLEEHTEGTWWCGALVVEPRYVEGLLQGYYGEEVDDATA